MFIMVPMGGARIVFTLGVYLLTGVYVRTGVYRGKYLAMGMGVLGVYCTFNHYDSLWYLSLNIFNHAWGVPGLGVRG